MNSGGRTGFVDWPGDDQAFRAAAAIQPHGALLVCDAEMRRVLHVSANLGQFFDTPDFVPGLSLDELAGGGLAHDLRNAAARAVGGQAPGFALRLERAGGAAPLAATIRPGGSHLFIEIEPGARPEDERGVFEALHHALARLGQAPPIPEALATAGARALRALLGYDQVLACRLNGTENAQVIGESKAGLLGSWLGQRLSAATFSSGDGRDLALQLLVDTRALPVPLMPAPGVALADLAACQLRALPPCQCVQLEERGMRASLSLPLIVQGAPWGFLLCLATAPKLAPLPLRIAAEIFVEQLSLRVALAGNNGAARQSELAAEERLRTEYRRRILYDELNHRVKNIIALVKSIATQTGIYATDIREYSEALEGRLNALAFAHDQSLSSIDSGLLMTLIEAEAGLHRLGADATRIVISGPPLSLKGEAFNATALVVHELMTNAAKYGALSQPQGRLEILWELTPAGDCRLIWRESDGPRVAPPRREGFGSKLIRSIVEYDLSGRARLDYAPAGLTAELLIPARNVAGSATEAAIPPAPKPDLGRLLTGQRVLVVEDQFLIALDTEKNLRQLGADEVYLCRGVEEAEALLAARPVDLAILDLKLGAVMSLPLAARLRARSIPFVFATGYGDNVMIPRAYAAIPVIRKPVTLSALAEGMARATLREG